jgi:CarD family transcriptional regulator, regulator of rRNA transcription
MFAVHEKVVYPGHGVAHITRTIEKKIAGQTMNFYELKFVHKDVTILVPTQSVHAVGIRPLSTVEHISSVFKVLTEPARKIASCEFSASNWNKRNKEYQLKLRTGNLKELLEIYRDLRFVEEQKELSFGEKNILQQTELLLAEEISLVRCTDHEEAVQHLRIAARKKVTYSLSSVV